MDVPDVAQALDGPEEVVPPPGVDEDRLAVDGGARVDGGGTALDLQLHPVARLGEGGGLFRGREAREEGEGRHAHRRGGAEARAVRDRGPRGQRQGAAVPVVLHRLQDVAVSLGVRRGAVDGQGGPRRPFDAESSAHGHGDGGLPEDHGVLAE